jgi:hypothetical protein
MIRIHLPGERELAEVLRDLQDYPDPVDLSSTALTVADPFGIDHDCINPEGHRPIADCSEVVCVQCGKVFWQ